MAISVKAARTEDQRCPRCALLQAVATEAVRHTCSRCGAGWAWAECRSCRAVACPLDSLESWRCRCGVWNRSWWKAGDRQAEASVASRRKADARLIDGPLRFLVVVLPALAVLAVVVSMPWCDSGNGARTARAQAACSAYRDWRSRAAAGVPADTAALVASARNATPAVRSAAQGLARAGNDTNTLLGAMAAMDAACRSS
ncbi:MAG TPA: hypothetical protein VFA94_10265 [Acidimicrobiales bacterium]|nr:hypothetical protein [Acidimicrobiales bacterium]